MRIRRIFQTTAIVGLLVHGSGPAFAQNRITTVEGIVFADHDLDGRQSPDEVGLDGVRVAVLDGPTGRAILTDAGVMLHVATDSKGAFRYQAPGNLDLRFRLWSGGQGWLESSPSERRVTIASGTTQSGVDFGYRPTRTSAVEGIVFDDKNRNGRRDRGEPGMRDVYIALLDPATGRAVYQPNGAILELRTDRGGHYRYEAPGTLDLRLRPRNREAATASNPEGWLDTNPAEQRVTVANGTVKTGVDFAF